MAMRRSEIPEEVLRFIERRIDSVPHLEALLILWEAPSESWTDVGIGARVYISADRARSVLADLARNGLIIAASSVPERYTYNTSWDESQLMSKVATAYRQHLVHLSKLIHAKAASAAVLDFARAFELKDKD